MKNIFITLVSASILSLFYILVEKYLFDNNGTYVWAIVALTQIQLFKITDKVEKCLK